MGYWDVGDESPRWPLLVAGAVAGALVVGLIWFVQAWTSDGVSDEPATDAARVVDPGSTGPDPSPDRLARCQEVFDAQEEPLQAADASLTQWEVHVGAMNKLVTGAITLEQATAFWDETRLSAGSLLARHSSATEKYFRRTARCPLTRPGTMSPAVAECAKAVAARGKALYEASVADARWREHVHHMEMLRTGKMSPDEATQLWLLNWRKGMQELRAYRTAADAAEDMTC